MEIAFTTQESTMLQEDLAFQVLAVDIQMRRDFAPLWGIEPWPCVPYLHLPLQKAMLHPVFVMDRIGAPGALGYHDDILNYVFSRIMTPVDVLDASTASHEALEMRADPTVDLWCPMADGREVAKEVGDPVEANGYAIQVQIGSIWRSVQVSNFVLPSYFVPGSDGPWDFLGKLSGPAPAMTPGGYLIVRDPRTGQTSELWSDRSGARLLSMKRRDLLTRTGRRLAKR